MLPIGIDPHDCHTSCATDSVERQGRNIAGDPVPVGVEQARAEKMARILIDPFLDRTDPSVRRHRGDDSGAL